MELVPRYLVLHRVDPVKCGVRCNTKCQLFGLQNVSHSPRSSRSSISTAIVPAPSQPHLPHCPGTCHNQCTCCSYRIYHSYHHQLARYPPRDASSWFCLWLCKLQINDNTNQNLGSRSDLASWPPSQRPHGKWRSLCSCRIYRTSRSWCRRLGPSTSVARGMRR